VWLDVAKWRGKFESIAERMQILYSIQFLRFVAAFLVVLDHSEYLYGVSRGSNPTLTYLFGLGAIGVHIFFVISGFIMVYTSFGPRPLTPTTFLARRFLRIYPIYWVYAALYVVAYQKSFSLVPMLGAAALAPGYSSSIIGQGWTLTYEVFFYLCFAASMTLGMIWSVVALTVAFVALTMAHPLAGSNVALGVITNPILMEFVLGAWIGVALLTERLPTRSTWLLPLSLLLILVEAAVGYKRLPSLLMWGIPSAMLLAGIVAVEIQGVPRWIKRVSFLGDSSYSLYLLHAAFLSGLFSLQDSGSNEALICITLALLTAGLSILPYYFVERPLLKLLTPRSRLLRQHLDEL